MGVCLILCNEVASREVVPCSLFLQEVKQNLPLTGILKQESNGFTYIDLDDRYIHQLIQNLPIEGFVEPPYFGEGLIGAHITLVMPDEWAEIPQIEECDQPFSFVLKECEIVHPLNWAEISEVFLITLDAPELTALREKYGLKPRDFDFHITIGVKKN